MKQDSGFTLIELIIFIVITSLLASTILLALTTSLQKTPLLSQQTIAAQTVKQCMEWFIGQRRINGFTAISCPSTTTPSFCTAPSGYNVSTSITCTTINGDSNYKTITVTVSGSGDASFTTLIGAT